MGKESRGRLCNYLKQDVHFRSVPLIIDSGEDKQKQW